MKLLATTLAAVATVSGFGSLSSPATDFDNGFSVVMGMIGQAMEAQGIPVEAPTRRRLGPLGKAASATTSAVDTAASATASAVGTAASATTSAVGTAASATASAVSTAANFALSSCSIAAYSGWVVWKSNQPEKNPYRRNGIHCPTGSSQAQCIQAIATTLNVDQSCATKITDAATCIAGSCLDKCADSITNLNQGKGGIGQGPIQNKCSSCAYANCWGLMLQATE